MTAQKIGDIGPFDAKILVVTDYPDFVDLRNEKLFSSPSGTLIKNILNNCGISFDKCFCTALVPHEIKSGFFDSFYLDKKKTQPTKELEDYRKNLQEKILNIRPNIVLLLGTEPLKAILNKYSIKDWRGSICKFNNIKVIPTFHPRYLFKVYSDRLLCELDCKKVREQSYTKEIINVNEPEIVVNPSYEITIDWLQRLKKDKASRVSFDIETTFDNFSIRTLGLAYKRNDNKIKSISIPFMKNSYTSGFNIAKGANVLSITPNNDYVSYFDPRQELVIHDLVNDIFSDEKIQKVGQNSISFDQPILENQFLYTFKNHFMDIMHAHHVCYLELPKGLDFLCSFYTNYSNYWSDKVTGDDRSNAIYNCWDAVVTLECAEMIEKELKEMSLDSLYFDHIHPLCFALTRAGEYGVAYDKELAETMKIAYQKELDLINIKAKEIIKKDCNLSSPTQLKELLYDELKYPKQFAKDGSSITTDAEAIKKLLVKYPDDEILKVILKHRELSKVISTYLEIQLDGDGIMRTNFNASGTDTGRISSSTTLRGTGSNLQNVPKDLRNLFVARAGCTLIKGDLSQAETLVVKELLSKHGDDTLAKRYEDPKFDIHAWAAAAIFEIKESEVTKQQRQVGKLANHSGNYGAGPNVLVSQAIKRGVSGITYQFSKTILEQRHKYLPGLRRWWKACEDELKKTRTITTALGRKRIFFGRLDESTFRTAYAFEPQSIVGDVANRILTTLDRKLPSDCRVVLQVHDEVVFECPDSKIEECLKIFKEAAKIEIHVNKDRKPLIIPIDISYGKKWGSCVGINDE